MWMIPWGFGKKINIIEWISVLIRWVLFECPLLKVLTIVDLKISLYILAHIKIIPVKFVFFLKNRLIFNIIYCFCMFVNKHFANFTGI